MSVDAVPVPSVLVTGATSGIGRATALALAEKGTDLTLLARSAQTLEQVREECLAAGSSHVSVVPADVADASALAAALAAHEPDAVVHSAAVMSYGSIADTPSDVLATLVRTNVLGSALVARESLRLFSGRGRGRLVLVSSLLGHVPMPLMGAYSMSKAAVSALGEVLQAETRQQPEVHVTVVVPGAVDTPIYDQAASVVGQEGRPPPPVVPPARVAADIVEALESPTPPATVSVGPANTLLRAARSLAPGLVRVLAEPAVRRFALSRPTPPTDGNVRRPVPFREAERGRWRGLVGRTTRPRTPAWAVPRPVPTPARAPHAEEPAG
jgi:short-subunit dehydrogenase